MDICFIRLYTICISHTSLFIRYVYTHLKGVYTYLSCSVVFNSLWLPGLYPFRLFVYGTFQARILEGVAISSSRGSSQPRDGTHISCIDRVILYYWATWVSQYRVNSKVSFLKDPIYKIWGVIEEGRQCRRLQAKKLDITSGSKIGGICLDLSSF